MSVNDDDDASSVSSTSVAILNAADTCTLPFPFSPTPFPRRPSRTGLKMNATSVRLSRTLLPRAHPPTSHLPRHSPFSRLYPSARATPHHNHQPARSLYTTPPLASLKTPIRIQPKKPSLTADRGPKSKEDTQTDFTQLDVLNRTQAPSTSVDVCTSDGFVLDSGLRITDGDGVMLLGGEAFVWRPWMAVGPMAGAAGIVTGEALRRAGGDGAGVMFNKFGQWEVGEEAWGVLRAVWPKPGGFCLLLVSASGADCVCVARFIDPRNRSLDPATVTGDQAVDTGAGNARRSVGYAQCRIAVQLACDGEGRAGGCCCAGSDWVWDEVEKWIGWGAGRTVGLGSWRLYKDGRSTEHYYAKTASIANPPTVFPKVNRQCPFQICRWRVFHIHRLRPFRLNQRRPFLYSLTAIILYQPTAPNSNKSMASTTDKPTATF